MRILEGEKVTKHFGGLAAVSQVDFHVDQGEIFGLIGPNGAGKTTLFNLISGAFVPKPGVIKFKGEEISGLKPHKICRMGMARTFQEVKIFGGVPAIQNVALGAMFGTPKGMSPSEATKEAGELLDFVGFSVPKTIPAGGLTLANQKRVEVARALATKAELIMLDELMAGLTPTETAEAMELVTKIRDRGVTVFMIEHVMKAIMGVCDRIMVLHHGEKIADGTPKEIATSKKVIAVYLGE
ncbi:Lipopolysaccharide export system ATP-binding protein LptB [subsurface metagenome]